MDTPPTLATQANANGVTITNIDIPFGRLIVIMLKMMLASIPAILIMYAALAVIMVVVFMIFGAMGLALGGLDLDSLNLPPELKEQMEKK